MYNGDTAGGNLRKLIGLLSADVAVSGTELAAQLGVTRTAVWKHIEHLRRLGVPVTAQAGMGYRLQAPIELLDRERIVAELSASTAARLGDFTARWELDSTNSELLRRAAEDPRDLLACVAEIQSLGRGRRGRAWHMPLGGGLALSLLKRFECGMTSLAGLSLAIGVALTRALADCGVRNLALKWPNDVVAQGRKLAGVLVELGGDALGPCYAVIGVGINMRLPAQGTAAIDQPWIDLAALMNENVPPPSRNHLTARLLTRLTETLDVFATQGFAAFAEDYASLDALSRQPVQVLTKDGAPRAGVAEGVDNRGALRVRDGQGLFMVDGGEVSVRTP